MIKFGLRLALIKAGYNNNLVVRLWETEAISQLFEILGWLSLSNQKTKSFAKFVFYQLKRVLWNLQYDKSFKCLKFFEAKAIYAFVIKKNYSLNLCFQNNLCFLQNSSTKNSLLSSTKTLKGVKETVYK